MKKLLIFTVLAALTLPTVASAGRRKVECPTTTQCPTVVCTQTLSEDLCPGYCDNNEWTILFDGGSFCQWTKETCVQDGDAGTCQGTNTTRPYPCSDGPPR